MSSGRVHTWVRDAAAPLGGRVETRIVPLPHLDDSGALSGRYVRVHNAGWLNEPDASGSGAIATPLGDARADAHGDFLFDHARGGPRVDKFILRSEKYRKRYVEAARFGEVNTYYHLDLIAHHVHGLLAEMGAAPLPPVVAVVHAHHAAVVRDGIRDGEWRKVRWVPFEGGHYRLPSPHNSLRELDPVALDGEIHLGPGWHLLHDGALADATGARYRHCVSHNAGVIYHEYGHHIARHTADFRGNAERAADHQSNIKPAIDEGYCDYWAATMLDVPHIWLWHRSHHARPAHARSLTSTKTTLDFDPARSADPHLNGTIWAAALWDLRARLQAFVDEGARCADKLVLRSMLHLGRVAGTRTRTEYSAGLAALLQADEELNDARFAMLILDTFHRRGIELDASPVRARRVPHAVGAGPDGDPNDDMLQLEPDSPLLLRLQRHVPVEDIAGPDDLWSGPALESHLVALHEPPFSMIAVGDVMLGARATPVIAERGTDHVFAAVAPLLRRAPIVLGNLEGPLARLAAREPRNHSYRVRPDLAAALVRAGFNVMSLANNHLLDCGREGALETFQALTNVGIAVVGAGIDRSAAHLPAILEDGSLRVGILGYYWNRRTAATGQLPGSAMDPPEALRADIAALRDRVDRVVVTFHWGVPYDREPAPGDREKAHLAIDAGADVVIGHHAHVVLPFEVYRGCPILYGVGNFAFGSGNSRAEGMLAALRFAETKTRVEIYPLYVKNRDPRVGYQPKVLRGEAAARSLTLLAERSGAFGASLVVDGFRGVLDLPRPRSSAVPRNARAG